MDFHFLIMEKSWKISVEKEGTRCLSNSFFCSKYYFTVDFDQMIMISYQLVYLKTCSACYENHEKRHTRCHLANKIKCTVSTVLMAEKNVHS